MFSGGVYVGKHSAQAAECARREPKRSPAKRGLFGRGGAKERSEPWPSGQGANGATLTRRSGARRTASPRKKCCIFEKRVRSFSTRSGATNGCPPFRPLSLPIGEKSGYHGCRERRPHLCNLRPHPHPRPWAAASPGSGRNGATPQRDLAKALFVTRQAVSNWERDQTLPDLGNAACHRRLPGGRPQHPLRLRPGGGAKGRGPGPRRWRKAAGAGVLALALVSPGGLPV